MNDLPSQNQGATGTRTEVSGVSTAKSLVWSFLKYAGRQAWIYFVITVLLGLTEGVGLLMLIPLLHLIGFYEGGKSDQASLLVKAFFDMTGLPLTLVSILCIYIAIVSAHTLASRYQEVLNARLSLGYTRFMQDRLYRAFARVDWLCLAQMRGTDVVRVLTNDLLRVGFATGKLLELVAIFVLTLIYLVVVLSVSGLMTLLVLASIAVILFFLQRYNRQAHSLGEAYQAAVENLYVLASEHLSGVKIAKSYGLESEFIKRFSATTEQIATQGTSFLQVDAVTQMYHRIGAAIALSAFFYIGTKIIAIPPSSLLLVVFVFARLSPKVSLVQHYTQFISNSLPAYRATTLLQERFEEAQESPLPSLVQPLSLKTDIRLSQVAFSYNNGHGESQALFKTDLVIRARSTVAVVGPSGSGKTTLADLIMGLLVPTEGTILIDGRPLTGDLIYQWRGSIGYVPQETFLFHDTIRGNLLLVRPGAAEEELWAALRQAAADAFVTASAGRLRHRGRRPGRAALRRRTPADCSGARPLTKSHRLDP